MQVRQLCLTVEMPVDGSYRISLEITHYGPVFEGPLKVPEYASKKALPDGRDALGRFLPHLVVTCTLVQHLLTLLKVSLRV